MKRLLMWLSALALLASGCGGSDKASGAGDVSSAQDVADMVGCVNLVTDSEEMFVTEGGQCLWPDDLDLKLGVYYFADNEARDNYVDTGSAFGGQYLVGDNWVVEPPRVDMLQQIQEDIGGEVRP